MGTTPLPPILYMVASIACWWTPASQAQSAPWYRGTRILDLTGDGVSDTVDLIAHGSSWQNVAAYLTIRGDGQILYSHGWEGKWHFMHDDNGSDPELRAAFDGILRSFAVVTPASIRREWLEAELHELHDSTAVDSVIRELLAARLLAFDFTPGDTETRRVLIWSRRHDRFITIDGCC